MADPVTLALVGSAAVPATATTAATAATTGLIGAGGAVTAGGLFSTALTVGSLVSTLTGGQQAATTAKAQAKQYELSARTEELKGREQADNIRRALQATLASQNAAFAGRGIQLGSGTPVSLASTSSNEASRDIQTAQFGSAMAADQKRAQGAQSRIEGSVARVRSYGEAAKTAYPLAKTAYSLVS